MDCDVAGVSVRMDDETNGGCLVGFGTTVVSKAAATVIQVVQVPVLLHFWGAPMFGVWMILTAIPTYLSFSNTGFGSVAGNEMTMLMARGEQEEALGVFQSCWWLISLMMGATGAVMCVALYYLPMAQLLNLHAAQRARCEAGRCSGWGWRCCLGSWSSCCRRRTAASRATRMGILLKSVLSLVAFGAMLVPVMMGYGPRTTAMVFALANITVTLILVRDGEA